MTKSNLLPLSNDISTDYNKIYVIKINNEDFCYVNKIDDVQPLMDKLAIQLVKETTKVSVKVYCEYFNNNKIIISIQSLGYIINGVISPIYTITYNAITKGILK